MIPKEIRRTLRIELKDDLLIHVDGEYIILSKYGESCIFCGSKEALIEFKTKNICSKCAEDILPLKY